MCVSDTVRAGWTLSKSGIRVPTLALKSPHTNVVSYGCILSMTSDRRVVACASVMSRRVRDDVGGM